MGWVAIGISVGALILAGLSWRAARESAEEARRARLDNFGPRVSIRDVEPQRERWIISSLGDSDRHSPGEVHPGAEYNMPGDAAVRLLIGADLTIANEGSMTVDVEIEADRVDAHDPLGMGLPTLIESFVPDRRFTVSPGEIQRVRIRVGPTIEEWATHGDEPYVARIIASSSVEAPRQIWNLALSTELLQRVIHNASIYRLLAATLLKAQLEEQPRSYPGTAIRWTTRFARLWSSGRG